MGYGVNRQLAKSKTTTTREMRPLDSSVRPSTVEWLWGVDICGQGFRVKRSVVVGSGSGVCVCVCVFTW